MTTTLHWVPWDDHRPAEAAGEYCARCGARLRPGVAVTTDGTVANCVPPADPNGPHDFVGRLDRPCELCARPDRNPVHALR